MVPVLLAVIGGYLLGSIPMAVLVGRTHGFDPRDVGDRNPGFWNMKEQLGWKASVPVFAGDALKGTFAGLLGLATAAGPLPVYLAVGAAMAGHAWPVFARFQGGRSILTFAGGIAVICPAAFLLAVLALVVTSLVTRSFATGVLAGVFGVPVLQLFFTPVGQVAATVALMSLIGLRFALATVQEHRHRRPGTSGPAMS